MKNFKSFIVAILAFGSLSVFAEDHETFRKNLSTCKPYSFSYPHPIIKGFTGKKIIKGKVAGKCLVDELMPNDMKMECKFNDACISAISVSGENLSKGAQKCFSDECTTSP